MEEMNKGLKILKLIKKMKDAMRQDVEHQFKEMNLTGPQGILLGTLAHFGEMKISDLSEKLGLSNSNVSAIADRLEKQGWIERVRSSEDRRVVYVKVTEECKKNAKEHFHSIESKFESMMNKATPEEMDRIVQGLETFIKVMERQNKS